MRIIGGKNRGRVIQAPQGLPVRPTTDQAKEGLFNILSHRFQITDSKVLELFAGTGNVSYEFWSRGAASVTAVDQHPACVRFIQSTFKLLGAQGEAICLDADRFVSRTSGPYQIVFMDPPYAWAGVPALLEAIFANNLVIEKGLVVVEHSSSTQYGSLRYFLESRKYGSSSFSFFQFQP